MINKDHKLKEINKVWRYKPIIFIIGFKHIKRFPVDNVGKFIKKKYVDNVEFLKELLVKNDILDILWSCMW